MKIVSLAMLLFMMATPSLAQNTKGDKPESNRESRFRKSDKKNSSVKRKESKRRTSYLRSYKPRKQGKGGEQAGKSAGRTTASEPSERQKPNRSNSARRVASQSVSGKNKNVYPKNNRTMHNPSKIPRDNQRPVSNRAVVSRLSRLQGQEQPPGRRARVTPRSASRSFTARKSINVQARYPRPKRRTERASTRDIAGRRLRTKNFETKRPAIISANPGRKQSRTGENRGGRVQSERYGRFKNYSSRSSNTPSGQRRTVVPRSMSGSFKKVYSQSGKYVNNNSRKPRAVEKPQPNRSALARLKSLQGPENPPGGKKRKVIPRSASGSFIARRSTNTWAHFPRSKKKGETASTKDIAGKRLRSKNFETPRREVILPGYKPYLGKKRVGDRPYRGQATGGYSTASRPGERAWRGDVAGRMIRGTKRPKQDTPTRIMAKGYRSASKPGEKRPGLSALPARAPGIGAGGIGKFQGNIKGRRPLKGGGSVSGRLWNNQNQAIAGKTPSKRASEINGFPGKMKRFAKPGFSDQGEEFTGNIKTRRPAKGGGSVSGRLWNNQETPVQVRTPGEGANKIGNFQGNIKVKRPEKGGGSISGKLWNNNETPIQVRQPGEGAEKAGKFGGNVKISKFRKAYVKNPNAVDEALVKRRPSKSVFEEGNLQVKIARRPYVKNPNSSALALRKLKPTKSTYEEGELQVKVRQYNYIKNPSSAENASKVREPGKAFARASDFQGNIKMQKFRFFDKNRELHPDARFVKTNKNNVADEKDAATNLKLWWARLFKKSETQPDHLKEKGKKPRYDKGEDGLWYD